MAAKRSLSFVPYSRPALPLAAISGPDEATAAMPQRAVVQGTSDGTRKPTLLRRGRGRAPGREDCACNSEAGRADPLKVMEGILDDEG